METNYSDFIRNYNTVSPVFEETLKKSASKYLKSISSEKIVQAYENISESIMAFIGDVDSSFVGVDDFEEDDFTDDDDNTEFSDFRSKLSNFLAFSLFNAYLGGFDTDKAVDGDIKFGFEGLEVVIESYASSEGFTASGAVEQAEVNLISYIRDVSLDDYLSGALYHSDMKQVSLLLSSTETTNEGVIATADFVLRYCSQLRAVFDDIKRRTLSIYSTALASAYGMRSYWGVLGQKNGERNGFAIQGGKAICNSEYAVTFKTPFSEFISHMGIDISESRQLDNSLILDSDKPIYFPFKILEFAQKKVATHNLNRDFYTSGDRDDIKSYDKYASKHIIPFITDSYKDGLVTSLLSHTNFLTRDIVANFESYLEDEIFVANFKRLLTDSSLVHCVESDLFKLERSYCLMFLITDLATKPNEYGSSDITRLKVRVVDTTNSISDDKAMEYFSELLTYGDKTVVATPFPVDKYTVIEFNIVLDSSASAAPLFGYKAVRMLKDNGKSLDRDNVLLGELEDGTDYISRTEARDSSAFQKGLVHYIVGYSGSGKGVMTMNIIASFIAAGVPIFYIDRKPDMSGLFGYLTDGNMFIVNGGNYQEGYDVFKSMHKDSPFLATWRDISCKQLPDYLKEMCGLANQDVSDYYVNGSFYLADLIYMRAVLFTAAIIQARNIYEKTNGEIYEKLGGEKGIFVVVDEVSNFENSFESSFFGRTPLFFDYLADKVFKKAADSSKLADEIDAIQLKLDKAIIDLNAARAKGDTTKALKIEKDIANYEKQIDKRENPAARLLSQDSPEKILYATQLFKKFEECSDFTTQQINAGFRDNATETRVSNMLYIGQNLNREPFVPKFNISDLRLADWSGLNSQKVGQNPAYMKKLTTPFAPDFFVGFNQCGFLEAKKDKLNNKERYFAFVPKDASTFSAERLKVGVPEGTVVFKPYLVLNTHFECDPEHPVMTTDSMNNQVPDPKYSYVTGLAENAKGMWKVWRKEHLKDPSNEEYNTLNDGIGFEGLIKETMSATGDSSFDFKTDLGGSKRIADYVAQCCGYSTYQEFLFDLTPKGMFSIGDIVTALADPTYFMDFKRRLPVYAKYDQLDVISSGKVSDNRSNLKFGINDTTSTEDELDISARVGTDADDIGGFVSSNDSTFDIGSSSYEDIDNDYEDTDDAVDFNYGGDVDFSTPSDYATIDDSADTSGIESRSGSTFRDNPFYNSSVINTGRPLDAGYRADTSQTSSRDRQYQTCVSYINHLRRTLPALLVDVFRSLPDDVRAVLNMEEVKNAYISERKSQLEKAFGFDMSNV